MSRPGRPSALLSLASLLVGIGLAGTLLAMSASPGSSANCVRLGGAAESQTFLLNSSNALVSCLSFTKAISVAVSWTATGGPVFLSIYFGPYAGGHPTEPCPQAIELVYSASGTAGNDSFNASATSSCLAYSLSATDSNSTAILSPGKNVSVTMSWGAV